MRKLYLGLFALALAAVPMGVSAQGEQPAPRMRGMGMGMGMDMAMMNPASMVLRHQAELGLTPAQLEKLGKIRDEFEHENGEALKKAARERDEIVKKYGPGPYTAEQREKMRGDRKDVREEMSKLHKNMLEAREDIRKLLTPEQFSRLEQMMPRGMDHGDLDDHRMRPGDKHMDHRS